MKQESLKSQIYTAKLSSQQKAFINSILPKGYSLQYHHHNSISPKISQSQSKKLSQQYKQALAIEQEQNEIKRRKIKSSQHIEEQQAKIAPLKRDEMSKMLSIVRKIKKNENAWPFKMPVNPKELNIPNYSEIVLLPMDLHTIQEKIKNERYEHYAEIQRDLTQMFLNSYKFNGKTSQYFDCTSRLQQYYHALLNQSDELALKRQNGEKTKKKEDFTYPKTEQGEKAYQMQQLQKQLTNLIKKSNQVNVTRKVRQKQVYVSGKNEGPISLKQKRQLIQQIKSLGENHLLRIIEMSKNFIKQINNKERSESFIEGGNIQVFHLDLDKLDSKAIRQLQSFVKLQKNSINHQKQESVVLDSQNQYSVY